MFRTSVFMGCLRYLAKKKNNDNPTIGEGGLLSASRGYLPSRCFGVCTLQLDGRLCPAFPLLGDVAVAFLNSMWFVFFLQMKH